MTIEQWALNYLATTPDPGLMPWQYAIGALIMGVIMFGIVSFIGEVIGGVSERVGDSLIMVSLPAGGLFALVAWIIMVSG